MPSFRPFLTHLARSLQPKCMSTVFLLGRCYSSRSVHFEPHLHHQTPECGPSTFEVSSQDRLEMLTTQLANCTGLSELTRLHAYVVRTLLFEFFYVPFHWNNFMRSYTRLESPTKALFLFISMLRAGVLPDSYTLPIALKAVCKVYAYSLGQQLHCVAVRVGLERNEYCESGFISVYSKAGEFEYARKVFDQNSERKLGSWNAIIGGLSQGGRSRDAIGMFIELKQFGFEPDDITIVSVMSACGNLGDLSLALQLHKYVFEAKTMEKSDILMSNSLIDMYGKCGRMDLALKAFSRIDEKTVSSWTSLIVCYAMHGQVEEAFKFFSWMREAGVKPNHVTFVGALSACVHGGMVHEGRHYFELMKNIYEIKPQLSHYGCMVDLLGRAGLLEEARKIVEEMPMKANSAVWGCLMGACEKHGDVKTGEWVAKHLQDLEPWNVGVYVVLSNIYATNGLWKEVEKIREIMKKRQLNKIPAYVWLENEVRLNSSLEN